MFFDLVGFFSRDPSVLHRVGHVLLKLNSADPRRKRCLVFADDLFQVSKIPIHRTVHIISKVIESLSGCKLQYFLNILIVIEYLVSLHLFFVLHLCCNAKKKKKHLCVRVCVRVLQFPAMFVFIMVHYCILVVMIKGEVTIILW